MSRAHVLLAGALSCWISPAQAEGVPSPGKVKRAEEELLLFALSLDRTTLAEAVSDIAACEAIGRAAVRGQEVTVEGVPVGGKVGPAATQNGVASSRAAG